MSLAPTIAPRRSVIERLAPKTCYMRAERVDNAAFPRPWLLVGYGNCHALTSKPTGSEVHVYSGPSDQPGCADCHAGQCLQRVERHLDGSTVVVHGDLARRHLS